MKAMQYLLDFITNPFIVTALSSFLVAQITKAILYAVITKTFNIHRLFGDGGMPSGHSATVVSLTVITALLRGLGSFEFAIAFILMVVVCRDAMGVRRETGKQATVINEITKSVEELTNEKVHTITLKEFVGHTPIQVIAGALIGAANAVAMYFVFR